MLISFFLQGINMKTSVVMATYNGEEYIKVQLESILKQTLLPDEIIISDDCSKDNTLSIVKKEMEKYHYNNYTINVNKENVGTAHNFKNGLSHASGDYIFFADQDDIWILDKIEKMTNAINKTEDTVDCLSGRLILIDKDGETINDDYLVKKINRNRETNNSNEVKKDIFNMLPSKYGAHGCTMCISKNLARYYIEFINDTGGALGGHDTFSTILSTSMGTCYNLDYVTNKYRRHENNASKATNSYIDIMKKMSNKARLRPLKVYGNYYNYIIKKNINDENIRITNDNIEKMTASRNYCIDRVDAVTNKKVIKTIRLIKYRYFYPTMRTYIVDILSSLRLFGFIRRLGYLLDKIKSDKK